MEEQQEIKTLREVPREPMHCGVPMRKMSNVGVAGKLVIVHVCAAGCGFQTPPQYPKEEGT